MTRIADDKLRFGGKWTYELTPKGIASHQVTTNGVASNQPASTNGATQLRITEDGEVYNPIFCFAARFVFGHHATIETYLKDLARKFGKNAIITE